MELTLERPDDVAKITDEQKALLARLADQFGLTRSQEAGLAGYVVREGMDYLLEKAAIVRAKPRENAARAFLAVLKNDFHPPRKVVPARAKQRKVAEQDGWRDWVSQKYPEANVPDSFQQLSRRFPSIRDEFLANARQCVAK